MRGCGDPRALLFSDRSTVRAPLAAEGWLIRCERYAAAACTCRGFGPLTGDLGSAAVAWKRAVVEFAAAALQSIYRHRYGKSTCTCPGTTWCQGATGRKATHL